MAKITADYLTRWYSNPKAMDMANILALMGRFGTTEGDRRQILRVELSEPVVEDKSASLVAIEGYREMLAKKSG
jgi:hypothetical protein